MIDIRKNAFGTVTIETSFLSKYDKWLGEKCGGGYFNTAHNGNGTVNSYFISQKLFKEFATWAFQGEQCCERDYDHDGNCDKHPLQCPECLSKNVSMNGNGYSNCNTCTNHWIPSHHKEFDTVQLKTDLKWDEKDDQKLQELISLWENEPKSCCDIKELQKEFEERLYKVVRDVPKDERDVCERIEPTQKVYKIRNKKDGLFRSPKYGVKGFAKCGKTWFTRGQVSAHIKNFSYNDVYYVCCKNNNYDCEVIEYELVEVSRTPVKDWKSKK